MNVSSRPFTGTKKGALAKPIILEQKENDATGLRFNVISTLITSSNMFTGPSIPKLSFFTASKREDFGALVLVVKLTAKAYLFRFP